MKWILRRGLASADEVTKERVAGEGGKPGHRIPDKFTKDSTRVFFLF
jgi:hypothetical protein